MGLSRMPATTNNSRQIDQEPNPSHFCLLSLYDAEFVIGVGTENIPSDSGCSFNFLVMDEKFRDADPETIDNCKKLFGELRFESFYDFSSEQRRLTLPNQNGYNA
jgi:hypothetical protein